MAGWTDNVGLTQSARGIAWRAESTVRIPLIRCRGFESDNYREAKP
jgi:hypothetical protein